MMFTVAVDASDIEFPCESGETVLDAAERAGYSCRTGPPGANSDHFRRLPRR
jgi:CDP-4-dehydro-6-deoxyglucose reductase